ncbi:MAG: PIN domain-containing protein [Maricaulaceae bacterium]|nr:PIN domain-containing protein [Maricaulaceae bacterium]
MILTDTSVWVDHLRAGDAALAELLNQNRVLTHPVVIGEIALGRLRARAKVLQALQDLPQAAAASDAEVLHFIEAESLYGRGVGYADAHLLAAARLTPGTRLWTRDRRLRVAAHGLGLGAGLD